MGGIWAPKIVPKPLQLRQKNNTNINTAIEQPKQELSTFVTGGGPSRTTNHNPQEGRKSNALRVLRYGGGYMPGVLGGGPTPMVMVPSSPPVVWYDNAVGMLKGAPTMHTNDEDDSMSFPPPPVVCA